MVVMTGGGLEILNSAHFALEISCEALVYASVGQGRLSLARLIGQQVF